MVARVTLAELEFLRVGLDDAVRLFEDSVLPVLREQDGYAGVYVLATPEGKALVMSFWDSSEAADAGLASGFYTAQVEKFVTTFKAPPGREQYDVLVADTPAIA
jgi:heme-degrading monooxygenase HmoA